MSFVNVKMRRALKTLENVGLIYTADFHTFTDLTLCIALPKEFGNDLCFMQY